jgi:hypothetical protein
MKREALIALLRDTRTTRLERFAAVKKFKEERGKEHGRTR